MRAGALFHATVTLPQRTAFRPHLDNLTKEY
jgi:hypothetical protein